MADDKLWTSRVGKVPPYVREDVERVHAMPLAEFRRFTAEYRKKAEDATAECVRGEPPRKRRSEMAEIEIMVAIINLEAKDRGEPRIKPLSYGPGYEVYGEEYYSR
jgi:hypothetical protein